MARAKTGNDAEAYPTVTTLRQTVERHASALELYARQFCDQPEDVVQEAFIQLAGQRHRPDNLAAWLYTVVRRRALTARRATARRRHHESAAVQHRAPWFLGSNGQAMDAQAATQALQGLALDQREIIVAHIWGGLTFDQIGELIGCASSTAHRRYIQALEALRERLEP